MNVAIISRRKLGNSPLHIFLCCRPVAKVLLIDVENGQVLLCLHRIQTLEHRDDLVASIGKMGGEYQYHFINEGARRHLLFGDESIVVLATDVYREFGLALSVGHVPRNATHHLNRDLSLNTSRTDIVEILRGHAECTCLRPTITIDLADFV